MTGRMDPVENAYAMFIGLIRSGQTPDQAEGVMLSLVPDEPVVRAAVRRYREIADRIINAREPETLVDPSVLVPWYTGPRPGDAFWPAFRAELAQDLDSRALASVDEASTRVVAHLPPPWKPEFNGRGLVLGYVQSGKTSNFTAVIAKAADVGYRLFVVLSGMHTNLRRQTQDRLDEQLVAPLTNRWVCLTSDTADFGRPENANALLSQTQLCVLAVVKKNKTRLGNLVRWLSSASGSTRRNCPILVIDDEADQASVNTRDPDRRAAINGLILRALAQPKIAYVGYTATPYANIFVDPDIPEDLYPRDFIVDLPRPEGYFGPERIFGREPLDEEEADDRSLDGLDMIRIVPDEDARQLRPPSRKADRLTWQPVVAPSLRNALRYFLLATAARRVRGHTGRHSSMLIHTTQYADIHMRYPEILLAEIDAIRADTAELRALWDNECKLVPADVVGTCRVEFDELRNELPQVLDEVRIVVDNYLSTDRLDYGDEPQVVIAIGGNTLSRGLTLEGLVVSFFLRTASAYDTLLQMGRWFGYRPGYEDLPRIWLTAELFEYFQFLATVETEIRVDVARYEQEDLTPSEFAVRVQTHPKLAITSALKMQAATEVQVSYSGRRVQTILFEHHDREWLEANLAAARRLVAECGSGAAVQRVGNGRFIWRDIPVGVIGRFLTTYRFHPESQDLVRDRIRDYIHRQNSFGELLTWNVGMVTRADNKWGQIELGVDGDLTVGLINRARMKTGKPYANIKSLMSHEDRVLDLGLDAAAVREMDDRQLQALRPKGVGLLVLYPINKDSTPRGSEKRTNLGAVEHVIGVGLVFPEATHPEGHKYMAVPLPLGDVEQAEQPDDEDIDTEASLDEVPT